MVSLKCKTGRGMFPHELAVLIKGVDGYYESMVDAELVKVSAESQETGWIDVGVVKYNGTGVLVELPRQVVSGGRRIWVPESEVDTHGHTLSAGDPATN